MTDLPAGVVLAPIWRRVVGRLLDQLVIVVPLATIMVLAGVRSVDDLSDSAFAISVAVVVITFVYEFAMIGRWGRTVGKFVFRTRAVRIDTAGLVLWSSAAIRALVPLAAGVIPGIGQLLTLVIFSVAFFDRHAQGLHDKAAGTIVVMHRPA